MDEAAKKKYLKSKYKVKKWESEFKQCHGTNPSKTDIKNAPSHIKEAYRTYWKLKTISLETSLVDVSFGDEDTMDGFSFPAIKSQNEAEIEINTLEDSTLGFDTLTKTIITSEVRDSEDVRKEVDEDNIGHTAETANDKTIKNGVEETTKHSTNSDETINESINENSIWGPHLSVKNKKDEDKSKVEKPVVLSRYTAKLFAGANFKIRNPRKSFIRREKSTSDIATDNSILDDSIGPVSDANQSFSQPELSLNVTNKSIYEEKETIIEEENSLIDLNSSKFKIVNTSITQKQCQPVSILQKTLLSNSIKPVTNRTVDKGWLDRLDKVNKANCSDSGIDLTDSSVISGETRSSPTCLTVKHTSELSDEDDVVSNSDSDEDHSKSFCSFQKVSKSSSVSRLSLNNELKRSNFSSSTFSRVNSESKISQQSDKRSISQTDGEIKVSESKKMRTDDSGARHVSCFTEINNKESIVKELSAKTSKEDRIMSRITRLAEIQNKAVKPIEKDTASKSKEEKQKEILQKKVSSGKANENFVKINIKKKTYVRGKKTMTFQKYKKQKWKNMKKSASYEGSGVIKCFKCGDVGHFAKNCMKACDQLLPLEDVEDQEESPFPTLQEAEGMAQEASRKIIVKRGNNSLPIHIAGDDTDLLDSVPAQPVDSDDIERLLTNHEPLFKLNEDGTVVDTPLLVLDALVQFGHQTWRPGQEAAVMRVLSGLSTLVTLSTGSGKSLCYQLPAYLYHTTQRRITLVVSPLVSLMEDQVFCGSPCLRVACLHTNQSPAVRSAVMDQLRNNSLHALLVSPEALSQGDRISELLRCLPPVAFACVDEAHCISQWSHNFRPSYLTLCQVLREKFGVKTFLGLTATATQATIASVCAALGLHDLENGVIRDTPLPNNLRLTVSRDSHRDQALIALLKGERFAQCRSIIIYCTRRDECQRLAAFIRTCLQDVSKEDGVNKRRKLSWNAEAYHAGLTAAQRRAVQKAFMSGKTRIVVATVAFGMGINKQDIQGIVHYNMPSSFERYVQEVGRAGRDGEIAHCHLFLNTQGEDLRELRRFVYADSVERHTVRRLLQRVFVPCDCGDACPGHEVAFSVADTVAALDLPEQNIETLLCYVELYARARVRVCNRAYTRCRVLSYKGPKLIRQAVKECPPLAVAVAMLAAQGESLANASKLEFPIFPVANVIRWDSGVVKQQLKALEWTKVDGQPRRSGLTVELFDLGFRVVAVGNLTPEELDATLDSLTNRVEVQETQALRQLQATFTTLSQVSHSSVDECMDEVDDQRCEQLKAEIRHYFTDESYLEKFTLPEVSLSNEDQVAADVRNLIHSYPDVTFTGRAVARIFHGIASPNFPALQWGRCRRYWRAHIHEDFKLIAQLATRELIKMR